MSSRKRLLLYTSLCLLFVAPAVAGPADEQPKHGGTLVIAQDQGPDRIDPHGVTMAFQHNIIVDGPYESLLVLDKDFNVHPNLAVKWVEESPTSYLFTLRDGVKFHDGSPLTADDVVFTLQRIQDPKRPSDAQTRMRMVKSVTAVDDKTVRFTLNAPSAPFLRYMASADVTGIVNRKFTLAHNDDLNNVEDGTGPFVITDFEPGVDIKYKRFDQYWQPGLPYLDAIDLRIIADDSTRLAAMRTGEIDMTFFRPDKAPLLRLLKNVTIGPAIPNADEPLTFNCMSPPLDKLQVRQALALSIDKDALMKTVLPGGLATPGLMIPSADKQYGYKGDGSDLPFWKQDIPKAKQLLADAGYPNGVTISAQYINTPAFAMNGRIAETMKEQVAKAGITINIQPVEYATLLADAADGKYQLQTSGGGMYPDPEGSLSKSVATNPRNACKDPKVDEMINQANVELDPVQRAKDLIDAQKYLLQQAYFVFFFDDPLRLEVWKNDVKGYEPLPLLRRTSLRQVWLDR